MTVTRGSQGAAGMETLALAVDIGGTKLATAIIDSAGSVRGKEWSPIPPSKQPDEVIAKLFDMVRRSLETVGLSPQEIAGIGIGSPGPLDSVRGLITQPPNLPGWVDIPLRARFEAEFGAPTLIQNDASLAGLGEHWLGAGQGVSDSVYMTVSTGIGGGIVVGGRLLEGATGNGAEVGHMTIQSDGPRCGCGNYGCLEALASGTAIAHRATELLEQGVEPGSSLHALLTAGQAVTGRSVVEAAAKGDPLAQSVTHEAYTYLGIGIANLVNIFNPSRVILGGGVSKAGEPLFRRVREVVNERALRPSAGVVEIVPAALADDSVLLGAAFSVFHHE